MAKLVRDIMKIGVPTCNLETPLSEIAATLMREHSDAVIVMDEFGSCGVISQSDLVRAYPRNFELLAARDVMTDKILTIPPDAAVVAAAHLMHDERVHQLFIMHEHPGPSRPSAVVTMHAIVRDMAGLEPERLDMNQAAARRATAKESAR
ncbi:MAG: CBS domain-containing protein [Chloroflexi bacterium]|nr:CBS domain-containing protein [Chloroflexota bacterium]